MRRTIAATVTVAALALGPAAATAVAPQKITGKGVGQVKLGKTFQQMRDKHLVGARFVELHLRELERRVGAVGEGRGDLHLRTIRSQHPHGHIPSAAPVVLEGAGEPERIEASRAVGGAPSDWTV